MAVSVKQPEIASGSHWCYWWSLTAGKISNRCEFDFISLEASTFRVGQHHNTPNCKIMICLLHSTDLTLGQIREARTT